MTLDTVHTITAPIVGPVDSQTAHVGLGRLTGHQQTRLFLEGQTRNQIGHTVGQGELGIAKGIRLGRGTGVGLFLVGASGSSRVTAI